VYGKYTTEIAFTISEKGLRVSSADFLHTAIRQVAHYGIRKCKEETKEPSESRKREKGVNCDIAKAILWL
jgi:hypothetical protein